MQWPRAAESKRNEPAEKPCCAAGAELARSGRALQQASTADLLPALRNSSLWLESDLKSLTGYGMRTLPASIADATTPVNGEKARSGVWRAGSPGHGSARAQGCRGPAHLALSVHLHATVPGGRQGRRSVVMRAT